METCSLRNAVAVSHLLLAPYVPAAKVLVDMTCGNGHDTAFLASHMSAGAVLYAFDIQEKAVRATAERLTGNGLLDKRIHIAQGSHDDLLQTIPLSVDIVVFNLGYLPSGNHDVHTESETTVKAVKLCLNKLSENGIIMIAAYPGTDAGRQERQAVQEFLCHVPQKEFDVSLWQPINQIHYPPILYIVQKRG